jgi:gamma-glutamyltranspeptidase/glutathione hydrolase
MPVRSSSDSDHHMRNRTPHGERGQSYRPVRMGGKGAVVANHPLAAQAGLQTLMRGGNAVDAAVTVGFALGPTEPQGSSIGGDGFVMVHMRDRKLVRVANGTGAAPLAATPYRFGNGIPQTHATAISVPGIVDALLSAHEKYGSLPLATCLEPAIELCEDGVPVSHFQATSAAKYKVLMTAPTSAAVFAPNGRPLKPGEMRRNPNLAHTYRLIAEHGRDAFYEGEITREIVRFSEQSGGLLSLEDFKRHRVRWDDPISTTYRGRTVYEAPPNSTGHVLLQELNLFEHVDPAKYPYLSSESIHMMVEAKRLAFADREAYVADPEFVDIPMEGMLSKEYAASRFAMIDPERAMSEPAPGDAWEFQDRSPDETKRFYRHGKTSSSGHPAPSTGNETTHFCVVDRWGNSVGELQSIQTMFGSCLIAGSTGILMNNRMTYWHIDENHINHLRPGQRVRHTMNPVMVFSAPADDGGDLELVCGTPGGDTQVQTNLQVVTGVFDYGLNVSEAIEGPRWTHFQSRTDSTYPHPERDELSIEDRVPKAAVEQLRSRGHNVKVVGDFEGNGSEGAIRVHLESRSLMAASDPRRDGDSAVW